MKMLRKREGRNVDEIFHVKSEKQMSLDNLALISIKIFQITHIKHKRWLMNMELYKLLKINHQSVFWNFILSWKITITRYSIQILEHSRNNCKLHRKL